MNPIHGYKNSKQLKVMEFRHRADGINCTCWFLDHGDEDFQQYLVALPYCVAGPAVIADSDGGSITGSGNSDASCFNDEIKQLEMQLLKL